LNVFVLTGSRGTDPGHPEGAGGRLGVLTGPDGVLTVDASYAPLAEKVEAAIHAITPLPIRVLIDTHSHPDHTGGNPYFAKKGAIVFAREEVWRDLDQLPPPRVLAAIGAAASFTDPARLPTVTYPMGGPLKIRFDGEIVDLIPVYSAHTDGDTIVRFEKADVYRNYGYPFIDPAHGGTFKGVVDALDVVSNLSGPNTQLVPGHGSIISRKDIDAYRAMILDIRARVAEMAKQGKSVQEVLAAKLTAPYDATVQGGLDPLPAGLGTSADRFVSAMYAEVTRTK
jgi:cyclase